jgi:hypothetical protein
MAAREFLQVATHTPLEDMAGLRCGSGGKVFVGGWTERASFGLETWMKVDDQSVGVPPSYLGVLRADPAEGGIPDLEVLRRRDQ